MSLTATLVVPLALALDLAFGEPRNALHPVAWLGKAVDACMRLAPRAGALRQQTFGALLALSFVAGAAYLGASIERLAARLPALYAILLSALALDLSVALRALSEAGEALVRALETRGLDEGREALAALCSRDARALDEGALLGGAVASLAENANDAVVAPLFYYGLFGLPGAFVFRAINTLDAMLGYRDHREHLGKASARLDDLAGYVPARLTALCLLAAGALLRMDLRAGLRIWRRDARKTPSPNGGHPMALGAGLLGLVLEKPGVYTLGEGRVAQREDVARAAMLVRVASLLFAFALCCALLLAGYVHA